VTKIIGICGISGSGKTFYLNKLKNDSSVSPITIVSFDDYYKPIHLQTKDKNGKINFDLPSALNLQKFLDDIGNLKNGIPVEFEKYHFNNSSKSKVISILEPAPIIVLEGIFIFHFKEIFDLINYKIYIEADLDTTFERRKKRDIVERGLKENEVIYQWENHVLPSYHEFILPYKQHADMILHNENPKDFSFESLKMKEIIISLKSNEK
jgi:uridine kinase